MCGFVKDKRPLCQLSSKRLENNWHSSLLFSTDIEDERPLCQLSSKPLKKTGMVVFCSLQNIGFQEGARPIAAELTTCGLPGVESQIVAVL